MERLRYNKDYLGEDALELVEEHLPEIITSDAKIYFCSILHIK